MGATYLVRFDDICPTMNWTVWRQVERILTEAAVKPILAVVPDNQDQGLIIEPAASDFWGRVRDWQGNGWTIGLHGYQHRYETAEAGIIGRNPYSEFAGLPRQIQMTKLRDAVRIFERQRVTPDVWIAPAHSFDEITLEALAAVGIRTISDGYSLSPHIDARGMFWVPQQIGKFRPMPAFVWTVCLHHNAWGARDVDRFRSQIHRYRSRISTFQNVADRYARRHSGLADRVSGSAMRVARSLRWAGGVAR